MREGDVGRRAGEKGRDRVVVERVTSGDKELL